jgi:hypothetical protein
MPNIPQHHYLERALLGAFYASAQPENRNTLDAKQALVDPCSDPVEQGRAEKLRKQVVRDLARMGEDLAVVGVQEGVELGDPSDIIVDAWSVCTSKRTRPRGSCHRHRAAQSLHVFDNLG